MQEEVPQKGSDGLAFLYETALDFVRLPSDGNIFRLAAEKIHAVTDDCLLVLSSFNPATDMTTTEAVMGWRGVWPAVVSRLGGNPIGRSWSLDESQRPRVTSGRLEEVGSVYELAFGRLPRPAADAIEKLTGIETIYAMGLQADGQLFGTVAIVQRRGSSIPDKDLLMATINQAAIAIQRWHTERELRRAEARYRTLVEEVLDPIFIAQPDGTIDEVNAACSVDLGYTVQELIGMNYVDLVAREERGESQAAWQELMTNGHVISERTVVTGDGSRRVCEAHATALPDGRVLVLAYDVSERRQVEAAMQETRDDERRRIGHELHDGIGQQLTGIGYLGKALERDLSARSDAGAETARRIVELLTEASVQTRRLTRGLAVVDALGDGLAEALRQLAEDTAEVTGICCRCEVADPIDVHNAGKATQLLHIAQEAVHNAVRHSGCNTITVTLNLLDGQGVLAIRDDGTGCEATDKAGRGMGMRIMRHRARMIGGRLQIKAAAPTGTLVECIFPRDEASGGTKG